jgi:threonine/homoserine/homoserine lactone efflux protein
MTDNLWASLLPLVLGSALVPAQLVITILLVRSAEGARAALAFVGGMTVVRLSQGALFGLVLSGSGAAHDEAAGSTLKSALLLVVAILLLAMAMNKLLTDEDPDAPPPAWLARTASMLPRQALLTGASLLLIGPKFWVFNLSAIAAIEEAALARVAAVAIFLVFVALTALPLLSIVAVSVAASDRSAALLEGMSAWLMRNNRAVVIGVGLVFGAWFLVQALTGLGVF